jgi:hypothetical protein
LNHRAAHLAVIIVALILGPQFCSAYETDQLTNRLTPISDSLVPMDRKVNESIEKAISRWRGDRNNRMVVNKIYHDIGGVHWVDQIERWAMNSDEIERIPADPHKSIYSGHPLWVARVAALFGVGPTIMIDGQLIGSDKLGHFLSQGRKFYFRYLNYRDETKVAGYSAYTERALFGQSTTGSYSNADLVANYEGYRFYRSLFEDEVIPGKPAILAWQGDHWVIQREFTWADHVNPYWDEALNVNDYDDLAYPAMKERFLTFCPDYFKAPDRYEIKDEETLKSRYRHLQLRDTSDLRLSNLCLSDETDQPVSGVAALPN